MWLQLLFAYTDLSSLCEYESVYYLNEESISEHENGTWYVY